MYFRGRGQHIWLWFCCDMKVYLPGVKGSAFPLHARHNDDCFNNEIISWLISKSKRSDIPMTCFDLLHVAVRAYSSCVINQSTSVLGKKLSLDKGTSERDSIVAPWLLIVLGLPVWGKRMLWSWPLKERFVMRICCLVPGWLSAQSVLRCSVSDRGQLYSIRDGSWGQSLCSRCAFGKRLSCCYGCLSVEDTYKLRWN